ncbi:MAG: helix-turn-helix domain-containing protein [Candidatus Gracilibacteria bacterium]
MIKEKLIKLGFSEKEIEILLTLYKLGQSVASTLARITSIKRASVYDILNSLIQKGLVSTFIQGGITYFAIDDINKILYTEREKLKIAENVITEIKNIKNFGEGTQVNYYKGAEGYREMYNEISDNKISELLVIINLDEHYGLISDETEKEWIKKRIKNKINVRLITQKTELSIDLKKQDKKELRKTKFLGDDQLFTSSLMLYKNFVYLFDPKEKSGIRIHNESFYIMFKEIFEVYWDIC